MNKYMVWNSDDNESWAEKIEARSAKEAAELFAVANDFYGGDIVFTSVKGSDSVVHQFKSGRPAESTTCEIS